MSQPSLKAAVRKHEQDFEHDVEVDDVDNPTVARCRLCPFGYTADGNREDTPTNPDVSVPAAIVDPIDPPDVSPDVPTGQTQPGPAGRRK